MLPSQTVCGHTGTGMYGRTLQTDGTEGSLCGTEVILADSQTSPLAGPLRQHCDGQQYQTPGQH